MKSLQFIAVVLVCVPQLIYIFQDGTTIQATGTNTTDCMAGTYRHCNSCLLCPNNTYQHNTNAKECIFCCYGSTTLSAGSKSEDDCVCLQGYHKKEDVCKPCPRGYYQDEYNTSYCKACPSGQTTNKTASTKESDCFPCPPGHYLNEVKMVCEPCGFDFYQPNSGAKECIPCPPKTKTVQTTSTSLEQCITICQCSSNATCLISGRTSKCVCKPYYKGNGDICIHQCDSGYCQNGCKCVVSWNDSPYCIGKDGYTGMKCESKTEGDGDSWIIGLVFGLLLLLGIMFTIFFCCMFREKNGFKMKVCRSTYIHRPCESKTNLVTQKPCDETVITRTQPCTTSVRYY